MVALYCRRLNRRDAAMATIEAPCLKLLGTVVATVHGDSDHRVVRLKLSTKWEQHPWPAALTSAD